jgi:putative glutathione S-transferase
VGRIIDGVWTDGDGPASAEFRRKATAFHSWVTEDGAAGPSGVGGFAAEAGRYRLYVSHACPWAHRTVIARALLRLEETIELVVTSPHNLVAGWSFEGDAADVSDDPDGAHYLHEVYTRADPRFTGRVTVPVQWDTKARTIVNNESEEIIRMFSLAFRRLGREPDAPRLDLYPEPLRGEIHAINERVYETVNDGVYRAGFARSQEAHDRAVDRLFETFEVLETRLSAQRWLVGNRFTEADLRLFTTLVRFDPVYHVHFKCSRARVLDYPALWGFVRDAHQTEGIGATVRLDHIRSHYFRCHTSINPRQVIAAMPDGFDLQLPHGRDALGPGALDVLD